MPERTKRRTKPPMRPVSWSPVAAPEVTSSERAARVTRTPATVRPTNVHRVTAAPPRRSASLPPQTRLTEPRSGPMKAIWAACRLAAAVWAGVGAAAGHAGEERLVEHLAEREAEADE